MILPFDREKMGKLDLDQEISRLFFGIGQVIPLVSLYSLDKFILLQVVVLAASLASRGKELRDKGIN